MYLHIGQNEVIPEHRIIGIFDLDQCSTSRRTREYLAAAEKEGVVLERRQTAGGAGAASPAYQRLAETGVLLQDLIARSRGRSNKDLAKLADQLKRLMEQWDS